MTPIAIESAHIICADNERFERQHFVCDEKHTLNFGHSLMGVWREKVQQRLANHSVKTEIIGFPCFGSSSLPLSEASIIIRRLIYSMQLII